jgi:DNA-binding CsgD family transcriptional regulator
MSEAYKPRSALVEHVRLIAAMSGGRVLVRGEPGLGKTTLLSKALEHSDDDGLRVLMTRASDWSAKLPHAGLIDLFDGISPDELDVLAPAQRDAVEIALSRRIPTHVVLPLTLRVAVTSVIAGLLQKGPVVVVVDDWSLLDDETAEILNWVFTRQGPASGAALVATERAGGGFFRFVTSEGARDLFGPQQICQLPPLEAEECERLIRKNFGESLTRTELSSIVRLARGNPLWALEIAHSRTDPQEGSQHPPDLPSSVAHLLMTRVSALPPAVANVLATVSALGESPRAQVLQTMTASPESLDDALVSGVVVEGQGTVRLAHPLLSKASMATIGREQHRNVHARAAATANSLVEKASHLDKASAPGPDGAVAEALASAADNARQTGDMATAAILADRALARTSEQDSHFVGRSIVAAEAALTLSDYQRAVTVLGTLDMGSLSLRTFDRVLSLHVDALRANSGEGAVAALLNQFESESGQRQPHAAMLLAHRAGLRSHPPTQRRHDAEEAIALLSTWADVPASVHKALSALVLLKLNAGKGLDMEALARIAEVEGSLPLLPMTQSSLATKAFHSYEVDDHETSIWALEALMKRADGAGQKLVSRYFGVLLAAILIETGDVARARSLILSFKAADPWRAAPPCVVLRAQGLLAIAEGDQMALASILDSEGDRAAVAEEPSLRLALQGLFAARSERWTEAVRLLQSAVDVSAEAGIFEPGRRMWLDIELGESLIGLGRIDEAELIADRLDAVAAGRSRPLTRARCLRLRGLLKAAGNDLVGAEHLFRLALDLIGAEGCTVERARLLFQLGRLLRRRRARARSRDHFERALLLANEAGDQLLVARIRREVERLGESAQVGELTASEARVAEAVLSGASNGDVAAAQFVSIRTVEAHLSAIYRKWGLRSRIQLVAELHRRAEGTKVD